MKPIETFARSEAVPEFSRRRLLQVLAVTVAATQLAGLSGGALEHANAATATTQPPAYDAIVGLL